MFFDLLFVLSKITKKNLCQDLLTIENNDSDLKVHALHYANELLVSVRLSFQKLLQTCSTCRNNMKKMFGKEQCRVLGVDRTTEHDKLYFNFYVFMFLFTTISTSKKLVYFSERDPLTRYSLVLSTRMQVILDSRFACQGSAPISSGKKGEFRDWGLMTGP